MKRARGRIGAKLNLKSNREAQRRSEGYYERRLTKLFQFRIERLARSRGVRAAIFEAVGGGTPISKFSSIIEQAAEQNDLDFLERLVHAAKKKGHGRLRRIHEIDRVILYNCDVFETALGRIPGLKFWTDKAAAAFVAAKIGEPSFGAEAYKKRRLRLGLHPEEPAIITSAKFVRDGPDSSLYTVTVESDTDRRFARCVGPGIALQR